MKNKILVSEEGHQVYAVKYKDDIYVGHVMGSPVRLKDLLDLYYDYRGKATHIRGVDAFTKALANAWKDKFTRYDNIDIRPIDEIVADEFDIERYKSTLPKEQVRYEKPMSEITQQLKKDIAESLSKYLPPEEK